MATNTTTSLTNITTREEGAEWLLNDYRKAVDLAIFDATVRGEPRWLGEIVEHGKRAAMRWPERKAGFLREVRRAKAALAKKGGTAKAAA